MYGTDMPAKPLQHVRNFGNNSASTIARPPGESTTAVVIAAGSVEARIATEPKTLINNEIWPFGCPRQTIFREPKERL